MHMANNKHRNRYKDKIGTRFSKLLSTHEVFRGNWRLIISAQLFLDRIIRWSSKNKSNRLFVNSTSIANLFNVTGSNRYRPAVDALRDLGLLLIYESYKTDTYSKSYEATELAVGLVYDANKEYLYKLFHDVDTKTKIRTKRNNIRRKPHNIPAVQHLQQLLKKTIILDPKILDELDTDTESTKAEKTQQQTLIERFRTGTFNTLVPNETDGRYWNEFVALKNEYKAYCFCSGKPMAAIIDIRACHPTYLGQYIQSHTTWTPELAMECRIWTDLWTNEDFDPRDTIASAIGRTPKEVKKAINRSINGHRGYRRFLTWFNDTFPNLFNAWNQLDIKETSNNISKEFEVPIMFGESIYKVADMLGIMLGYEYDGFRLFSKSTGDTLKHEVECIVRQLKESSQKVCGITPVIKYDII